VFAYTPTLYYPIRNLDSRGKDYKIVVLPTTICDMNKRTTFVKLGWENRDKLSHQNSCDYVKK
jgi:hypothetical protein